MDRHIATQENLDWVVNQIKASLKIVNAALISPNDFHLNHYSDLLEIYQMIEKKSGKLTMMEIEGVLEELREIKGR